MKKMTTSRSGNQKAVREYERLLCELHPGFSARLLAVAPNLSYEERKVCKLIRLHFNPVEAANLLEVPLDRIRTYRSNVRRKLRIDRSQKIESVLYTL
jgi:DNA-directed RNA polymerase specialized sigma24 family protein